MKVRTIEVAGVDPYRVADIDKTDLILDSECFSAEGWKKVTKKLGVDPDEFDFIHVSIDRVFLKDKAA